MLAMEWIGGEFDAWTVVPGEGRLDHGLTEIISVLHQALPWLGGSLIFVGVLEVLGLWNRRGSPKTLVSDVPERLANPNGDE